MVNANASRGFLNGASARHLRVRFEQGERKTRGPFKEVLPRPQWIDGADCGRALPQCVKRVADKRNDLWVTMALLHEGHSLLTTKPRPGQF